ncbi:type II toxin-antitoxin system HipA family toxin [Defluviimonas salinarum]|uniref:Type II toxin-antitoxin system HipA family toxin n=1 Tax=Defluviimonas salinarum TaxID=2992147 RepID=A0ABT3J5I1_9RHOB|nr:type II toxin-antitoxin system HipA family toxin [Defluviimonas salinarum]MCW3782933.1 type II toxin-antitoxin system HipA family toxin [Defluviimonas salinarum]
MDTLRVWVNDKPVGRLARHGRGSSFAYDEGVDPADAVSLTMPVRVASYDTDYGMLPVFDTNLPEGALLERVRKAIAKTETGRVDALDVLSVTGGNQIGRIRILPNHERPERRVRIGSIDEILDQKASAALIAEITDRYALRSGVSGAMPKVLVPETGPDAAEGRRTTLQTREYILKFDDEDYPGLSLNEYHCLQAAGRAGNRVSDARLNADGRMLSVRRFDEDGDGRMGFEDLASLNAKTSERKYEGSIEKSLFKTVSDFSGSEARQNLEELYRLVVTNIALRNGDAHLKNFAILYGDAQNGPFRLAPAYDIVTTRVWLANDLMALTLGGTKRWPDAKTLKQLGARAKLAPARAQEIIGEVAAAVAGYIPEMRRDLAARGQDVLGEALEELWLEGLETSLGWAPATPGADPEPETEEPGL